MEAIPFEKFLKLTGFTVDSFGFINTLEKVSHVVAPTDLVRIFMVSAMPMLYLEDLLSHIGTLGDPDNKIYANTNIRLGCVDPNMLLLGQKFVYRKNYTAILESFRHLFAEFAMPRGIFKLTPFIIVGQDTQKRIVIAHYLPPIIEVHGNKQILLDGVHRNFIAKQTGNNPETIIIERVKEPFPCEPEPWEMVHVADEKPE